MLEVYQDEAPPKPRAPALKPKLRSWTGRVWRWHRQGYQLMLKIDVSLSISEIEDNEPRKALAPFSAELSSFRLYLDHGAENRLALPWAVGSFNVECDNKTFVRFYEFSGDSRRECPAAPPAPGGSKFRPDLRRRSLQP